MHTGIRASRTMQMNMLLSDAPKHIHNFSLNGRFFRLNLPTVEIRSVVGNGELEIAHSKGESSLDVTKRCGQICCRALPQRCLRGKADNHRARNSRLADPEAPALPQEIRFCPRYDRSKLQRQRRSLLLLRQR